MAFRAVFPLTLMALVAILGRAQGAEYPAMGPDLFDSAADGEALISRAVETAKNERKHVLAILGANWCPWTRRLHRIMNMHPQLRAALEEDFVVVFVDVNTRRNRNRNSALQKRLGDPSRRFGIPAFVGFASPKFSPDIKSTQSLAAPTDEEVGARFLVMLSQFAPLDRNTHRTNFAVEN